MSNTKAVHLKRKVKVWAKRVGRKKAVRILSRLGVGHSTTYFLISGTYSANPKDALQRKLTRAVSQ